VSAYRQQALIEAPVQEVWELIGNPVRHAEWWPRVVEVQGERFDVGDEYRQVSKGPMGQVESLFAIDARDDLHHLKVHCTKSGTFADWALTEARGETFVDVSFGMEPIGVANRFFDATFGRRYFRSWMNQSVNALRDAAAREAAVPR